jgi:hypothetical protein
MRIDGRTIEIDTLDFDQEQVDVDPENLESFAKWFPVSGPIFSSLQERQKASYRKYSSEPETAIENWRTETQRVASRCINPDAAEGLELSTRQLVVGRVQSGKTTNFTGVMGLLADNGYRLFVVIGGTTTALLQQTKDRLADDLGNEWFSFFSTDDKLSTWSETEATILKRLQDFERVADKPNAIRRKKAICITVLKWNLSHLNLVEQLLAKVADWSLMERFPVAVIDDECDTFTPNSNVRRPEEDPTAIHKAISAVIEQLPVCTYLGYTATPMANEVQALDDALKPQKVTVLEPGADYLGPEDLFHGDSAYATVITDWDAEIGMPESLKEAVGTFLTHSVLFHHQDRMIRSRFLNLPVLDHGFNRSTSMLVHVARETKPTQATHEALEKLIALWKDQLSAPPSTSGKFDLQTEAVVKDYLLPPLTKLGALDLISESDLVELAGEALSDIGVKLIIGRANDASVDFPPESELQRHQTWIFVGAQLLDRGQTLPNLLVTYLARSSGGGAKGGEAGGNVDTLLQRGRFFGYRRQYQKLLKGYFSETSYKSLKGTAHFEIAMREKLKSADKNNLDFRYVATVYEMDPSMPKLTATRKSVIPTSFKSKTVWKGQWCLTHHKLGVNESSVNYQLFTKSIQEWMREAGIEESKQDVYLTVPIATALDFLEKWNNHSRDREEFEYVRKILAHAAQAGKFQNVDVAWRQSTTSSDGRWERSAAMRQADFYNNDQSNQSPTDRKMVAEGRPTIQLKLVRIMDKTTGEVLLEPVPTISVNLGADARYLVEMDQ